MSRELVNQTKRQRGRKKAKMQRTNDNTTESACREHKRYKTDAAPNSSLEDVSSIKPAGQQSVLTTHSCVRLVDEITIQGQQWKPETFREQFEKHDVLLIKNVIQRNTLAPSYGQVFVDLCTNFESDLAKTFTVENYNLEFSDKKGDSSVMASCPSQLSATHAVPQTMQQPPDVATKEFWESLTMHEFCEWLRGGRLRSFYVSLIIQDSDSLLHYLESHLPLLHPPLGPGVRYDDCYWLFVGYREENCTASMIGREEHRDELSCAGTWHLQLEGSKVWTIRTDLDEPQLELVVEQGDIIIINTRTWLHQTSLFKEDKDSPPSASVQRCSASYSMSYARDFWLPKQPV